MGPRGSLDMLCYLGWTSDRFLRLGLLLDVRGRDKVRAVRGPGGLAICRRLLRCGERRSIDCLRNLRGWKFEKGALVNDPEDVSSAQTKFEFGDGELRVRFETKTLDSCSFRVRQSEFGACGVFFDGVASKGLDGRPHELIFTCKGGQVSAMMDGKAIPLYDNKPVRSGCFQFNGTAGTLRVTGLAYRELR